MDIETTRVYVLAPLHTEVQLNKKTMMGTTANVINAYGKGFTNQVKVMKVKIKGKEYYVLDKWI